ncbi:MAG TPA: hypothetical protein VF796_10330 [Humisphaera sp.]
MYLRTRLLRASLALAAVSAFAAPPAFAAADAVLPKPAPADPAMNNPWPAEWEAEFNARAAAAAKFWAGQKPRGGTYGENEKNFYPTAMWAVLTGNATTGLKALQENDVEAKSHNYTNGVDFYWCFTLKGQTRKYFYFGDQLDPAYRARMKDGAAKWLATDPRKTEHPVYGKGSGAAEGWGPEVKGRRVDNRNTDNLRAMRNTAMYLFAEEVGNEPMRLTMKKALLDYAHTLYNVGMSEWDSPNYHAHTLAPYHNLYDFAKDPQVKAVAKATLDWLYAAAAVKYRSGGFGAPNARDYGGNAAMAANVTKPLFLYFGDAPPAKESDRDDLYHITSGYRPPAAVVELARKNLKEPVEFFATKPAYVNWEPGQPSAPAYWETQYLTRTFQIGTCVATDTGGPWNVNAFKQLAGSDARGCDYFVANTGTTVGHSFKHPGDQVGQYRNLVVWLRPAAQTKPLAFQFPASAKVEEAEGVTFYRLEKTWLAVRPINLTKPAPVAIKELTASGEGKKKDATAAAKEYADYAFARASAATPGYHGFALEAGDDQTHGSYDAFKQAVLTKGKLDVSQLAKGTVTLTSPLGHALTVTHNAENERPTVARDGKPVEWDKVQAVWQPTSGPAVIAEERMSGRLRVEANGRVFEGTLGKDGKYAFANR